MDPLPPLKRVYSLVAQEESHEGIDVVDDSKVLVNAVESKKPYGRGKGFTPQGGKGSRQCSFCGKSGHTIETCYRKHGFPPNYGNGKFNSNANSVQTEDSDESCKGSSEMTASGSLPAFTKEQYDSILALIQSSKIASPQHMVDQVNTSVSIGHQPVEASTSGMLIVLCLFPIVWPVLNPTPGY